MRRPFVYSIVGAFVVTGPFADCLLGQTNLALQPLVPKTQSEQASFVELPNASQPAAAPIVNLNQIPSPGMQQLPPPAARSSSGQTHALELAPLPKPAKYEPSAPNTNEVPSLATLPIVPMRKIVDDSLPAQQSSVQTVAEMIGPAKEPSQLFANSQATREFLEGTEYFSPQRSNLGPSGPIQWSTSGYAWQSPAFCYSPLYFEQINFERYGQGRSSPFAGASSAARFVGHTLILPISMMHTPPWCKECTLGHHRPGDCTPIQRMHKP